MIKIALAGQPNCGKSTIFNMLSGIYQHIANYPGVTVDKKSGRFSYKALDIEMVDLPGTYSFSSYSLEERVAKEFILNERPDIIINVVDASNLKRNLYLTFQLLEIGIPVIVVLNMMDVAKRRGIDINTQEIQKMLKCPVIETSGAKAQGKNELLETIYALSNELKYHEFKLNYDILEPYIEHLQKKITVQNENLSQRWLSIKTLEEDQTILSRLSFLNPNIKEIAQESKKAFQNTYNKDISSFFASTRYESADIIYHKCVKENKKNHLTVTDIADKYVLNRWLALPILFLIIFAIYQLSIVLGYKITDYTWPLLAAFKNLIIDILPQANFTEVPLITDFGIWMVNSANALLNYIPIFLILFALIAILEDVGYMPRMAFILDRVFKKFGLHGQSTLPLVLGGAFVGGCAVPGIMSTKGIPDDRARLATILSVPYMNCLAKVPFYTLLLGAFFSANMALMMFFISTVTIFIALIVAKLLTSSVLKNRETAPFVMELPPYHLPTFKGVIIRAFERVWLYIKKVVTIVLAVAIILFALLQFPGLNSEKKEYFEQESLTLLQSFDKKMQNNTYYALIDSKEKVADLLNYYDEYRSKRMLASSQEAAQKIDDAFTAHNQDFFLLIKPKTNKDARIINKELRSLSSQRNKILREIKNEKIENSLLGMMGRAMEPLTMYAGFDWKINVAFLSSFAARESAVATLGSIYENNKADNQRSEEAMALNSGYTPLHAVAMIIFMVLTPPCIATMIVVKIQTNSYKWMLFAIFFPITLGIVAAISIFQLGTTHALSGIEAMTLFYAGVVLLTLIVGLFPTKRINWTGGIQPKTNGLYSKYIQSQKKEKR